MSNTDTSSGDPAKTNINIRLTETFLEDIDTTWQEEGYNSRSEFIRDALRDAVRHPDLTRESWKEIAAVEHARRTGKSETFAREDIVGGDEWHRGQDTRFRPSRSSISFRASLSACSWRRSGCSSRTTSRAPYRSASDRDPKTPSSTSLSRRSTSFGGRETGTACRSPLIRLRILYDRISVTR